MSYDNDKAWIEGKKRIQDILMSSNEVEKTEKVPIEDKFSFDNGYYAWVTAVFVDIRNSTELFTNEDKTMVAKMVRSFMSEVVEILRDNPNRREIGIRGDCVYAIYTTSTQKEDTILAKKTFTVNTFLLMFNELLRKEKMPEIKIGIGVSTAKELVVKTGRKGSGINNLVWIGKAVTYASKFSNMANKINGFPIIFSESFYENMLPGFKKDNPNKNVESLFHKQSSEDMGNYYYCNVHDMNFKKWIKEGMKNR